MPFYRPIDAPDPFRTQAMNAGLRSSAGGHSSRRPIPVALAAALYLLAAMSHALELQGHRGARGLHPENSLHGFAQALAIGVHTLELDTAITRDGVMVIAHDPRLNPEITRGDDGRWIRPPLRPISTMTFAELQRYDVGRIDPAAEYAQRFAHQRGRDGVRIPRLSALLQMLQDPAATNVRVNIETKIFPDEPALTVDAETFARTLIGELRVAGMAARATIQSFDWRTLAVVQREAPDIATAYLTAQQPWMDNIGAGSAQDSIWTGDTQFRIAGSVPRMVKAAGGRIWSPFHGDLSAELIAQAHTLGLRVIAWTANTRADIERLIDWQVDGIISDYPDLLRTIAAERGVPLPAPVRVRVPSPASVPPRR